MSQIFLDRSKLSPTYVPGILPHREEQINLLRALFRDFLQNPSKAYLRSTQLIGGVGSGKTCTILRFGEELESEAIQRGVDLKHLYLNCKIEGSKKKIILYRNMLEKVSSNIATKSLSSEEMLHQLIRHLIDDDKYLLITLDEIGYLLKRADEPIVYDFTRLNEIFPREPCRVIGTVFISRDTSFHKNLDPSELSTLGRSYIKFERYGFNEIKDILNLRVKEAFKSGTVDEEIIELISDATSKDPINGDVRVALDILRFSGLYAEGKGSDRIRPEYVRHVLGQTHPFITTEDILNVSEKGKLILLGLTRALENNNAAYVGLREIRESYQVVCEEHNVQPVLEVLEEEVQDLIDRGIVTMKSLTQFGITGVTAKDLGQFLTGIRQRIYSGNNSF